MKPTWALLVAAVCATITFAGEPKYNVLFIAVDDLRPELACYGSPAIHSPNIDRLAANGFRFERAYCQVAVCNPSRNSVLSGLRPDTTGIYDNRRFLRPARPDVVTLPQHFKNHGAHAVSIGKVFHHSENEPGDDPDSWSEPAWYHGKPYRHWFTPESNDLIKQLRARPAGERPKLIRGPAFEAADEPDDSYPDGQTARQAIDVLQRLKAGGKPFFLAVGFVKPHLPFTCPQKYWELYPADSIREASNAAGPRGAPPPAFHDWYELRTYAAIPPEGDLSPQTKLNLIRAYRACVSFVDAQIGRVVDELDRLELCDDTIVVLWGDHGYHLGENGIWTKMTNFESGTRVPLIVSVPGHKSAGKSTPALVELIDLYPTLTELAGLPAAAGLEGTSLVPLLENPDRNWKSAAFSQYLRPSKPPIMGRSIRTAQWRYTEWRDPKNELVGMELYDEINDAGETENIASSAEHREVVANLAEQLRKGWRAAVPQR